MAQFWRDDHENSVLKEIGELLRAVEGAVVAKFQSIPVKKRERYDLGALQVLFDFPSYNVLAGIDGSL